MTRSSSNGGSVASSSPRHSQPEFRLLLDQGFPKPKEFAERALDATVEVVHPYDFDRRLSQARTPNWVIYCVAAQAGFDGLVARDRSQLEQLVEMFTLSRLVGFTVITWRRAIEDPVREWGQLLAYLPEVKKRMREVRPRAILLPEPKLTAENLYDPMTTLGELARRRGISVDQARREALREMRDWLEMTGDDPTRFDAMLGI